jgi:hypothetical protein
MQQINHSERDKRPGRRTTNTHVRRILHDPAEADTSEPQAAEPPNVRDDEIFEAIPSLVVGGLARQAPRPCGCGAHAPMSVRA